MQLDGRVALVTAAGRGIGRGIAEALAQAGADVVVNSFGEETTAATAEAVRATGRRALAVPGDATEADAIRGLVAAAMAEFGRIDVVVNNVGAGPKDGIPQADDPLEQAGGIWDALYRQNLRPAVLMTEAVSPILIEQGDGRIVNISSIAGHASLSEPMISMLVHPSYGAMKAALSHYTTTSAELLGRHGITVNAVCPGIVWTDSWAANAKRMVENVPEFRGRDPREWFLGIARGEYPQIFDRTPLRREQTVEDIGAAVVFLASDAAANITGQALMVDGGMVKG
jgi:meso-butanediol dehydrogenase/(S,S)-butanediol dehydrogenase/diacetyl reductase